MTDPSVLFNADHAATYDTRYEKLAAQRDGLHLLIRILFGSLSEDVRILCVGAGTGTELLALAAAFPRFTFTAVEPSAPMLDVCRRRSAEAGLGDRCEFHHGFLDSLPPGQPFHAATSILVSQFITDRSRRAAFFSEIARRLHPAGLLVNVDLSADLDNPATAPMKDAWAAMLIHAGLATPDHALDYLEGWRQHVAVLPPTEVATLIATAGFQPPTLCYQSFFIHGWFTQKAPAP